VSASLIKDLASGDLVAIPRGQHEALVAAAKDVLSASDEFRAAMGSEWEGDPLTDACDQLRAALRAAGIRIASQ
jgi:hypothetical protein